MCGTEIEEYIQRGHRTIEITVKCGSTSPDGSPWLCHKCERKHEGRDWRGEAIEAGETWGDEDY